MPRQMPPSCGLTGAPPTPDCRLAFIARQPFLNEAAIGTACSAELAIKVLQFGTGSKMRRPCAYTVSVMIGGTQVFKRDCAIWIGGAGRAVMVPRDRDVEGWFELPERGFARRSRQRTSSLAAGRSKQRTTL